jgi:hypothetical protein
MANRKPVPDTASPQEEKRRSGRIPTLIPVELEWSDHCRQHAEAEVISAYGALLRLKIPSPIPIEFQLNCPGTGQSASARVVCVAGPASDGLIRLGVELDRPSETFWGISF